MSIWRMTRVRIMSSLLLEEAMSSPALQSFVGIHMLFWNLMFSCLSSHHGHSWIHNTLPNPPERFPSTSRFLISILSYFAMRLSSTPRFLIAFYFPLLKLANKLLNTNHAKGYTLRSPLDGLLHKNLIFRWNMNDTPQVPLYKPNHSKWEGR